MQEFGCHKTVKILSEYVKDAELLKDHAGSCFLSGRSNLPLRTCTQNPLSPGKWVSYAET